MAWAISNRVDVSMLVEFLKPLKARVEVINPAVFMSDMADQFYTAWIGVFGASESRQLYCAWHVDKAWRKALSTHVEGKEAKIEVYHHLRVLLQETEEAAFRLLLQQFLSLLLAKYPQFYAYFNNTYATCTSKWAFCFCIGSAVNTNMFIEAFHRKVYLQGKQNRRIDKLVFTLLKMARDLIFEGLRKEEIGKRSHRNCEIRKRCQTAKEMREKGVKAVKVSTNTWSIASLQRSGMSYSVQLHKDSCDCHLKCTSCNACIHMYTCTCTDHVVHYTVCKHAHFIHLQTQEKEENVLISNYHI